MKRLLLILAVAGITDLPGCYVCTTEKIGSTVNFSAVTWPTGVSLPPELVPLANANCTATGWVVPTLAPYDPATLPPPVQVPVTGAESITWPIGTPAPYVFPTNVPTKPTAP